MKKSFRAIRIMVSILVVAIAASAWFLLYQPNRNAIQGLLVDKAVLEAGARAKTVLALVERCREGAESLSSRTMLRRAMRAYRDGTQTFEDAADFHKGPYDDGARVLSWLSGAERHMDGRLMARYGDTLDPDHSCENKGSDIALHFHFVPRSGFLKDEAVPCADSLRVVSPIIDNGLLLGHDCVCYHLEDALSAVRGGQWDLAIIPQSESSALIAASPAYYARRSPHLFRSGSVIGVLYDIPGSDSTVVVRAGYDELFEAGFSLTRATLLRFMAVLVVLLAASNLFVVLVLHRLLSRLQASRDSWREDALRDSLTGLYSRRSLEFWIDHELPHEEAPIAVVMIDLDGFKDINDRQGHEAGDRILVDFARFLQSVLRTDDLAIRYGGDEFLLLLRKSDEAVSRSVMARLEETLAATLCANTALGISWGFTLLEPPATRTLFEAALRDADTAMYRMKESHRKGRRG